MTLRPATIQDLPIIMNIIHHAQTLLRNNDVDQWQNGYPNAIIIQNDILHHKSFVVIDNNTICATVMISFDPESTYQVIDGDWLTHQPYIVMHRMAVEPLYYGKKIAEYIFKEVEFMCLQYKIGSIRVDTHADNQIVQYILAKLNFIYCGTIKVQGGALRLAYEKIIE